MDKDHEGGEVFPTMKSYTGRKVRKLNYTIHNPNTAEETAKVLLEICVQANTGKVEKKLRELAKNHEGISGLNENGVEVAESV